MAQYNVGTANFTNGSPTVTGNGTAWDANLATGDYIIKQGEGVVYTISSVTSDTELTLTANYGGATAPGVAYVGHVDFTPNRSIPVMQEGDLESISIFNAAMLIVDQLVI